MLNLILAICCSAAITLFMKLSESRRKSSAGMIIFNYAVCSALGAIYLPGISLAQNADGLYLTFGLGALTGILYLVVFLLLQVNITRNGVILGSVFMRLGIILPVLISIIFFKEIPDALQIAGIIMAIAAIIVFNIDKNEISTSGTDAAAGSILLLIALFLGSGISESMINIYDNVGVPDLNNLFLEAIFFFALVCSVILYFVRKEKMGKWDIIFGLLIGVPNYYTSRFFLAALKDVPAVVAYPVYSVSTLLIISILGVICFKEHLTKRKIVGLVMVIAAVAMLQ